jgi:hypothetical protein
MKLYEEFKLWETLWENTATDNTFNEQDSLNKTVPVNVKGIETEFATPFLSYNKLLKDPKFLKYKNLAGIYIYKRIAPDGKPAAYYVGQAKAGRLAPRFSEHASARKGDSLLLHLAIDKYTINNFKIAIIEFCPEASDVDLDNKEKNWIKIFNTFKDRNDYNATPGGDGGVHYKLIPDTEPYNYVIKLLKESNYTYTKIAKLLKENYDIKVDRTLIGKLNRLLEIRTEEEATKYANEGNRETQAKKECTLYCKEIDSGNIKCLGKFACRAYARDYMFEYEKEVYRQEYPEEFKQNCMERGKSKFRSNGYITLPDPSKLKKDNTDRTYFVIPPEKNTRYL